MERMRLAPQAERRCDSCVGFGGAVKHALATVLLGFAGMGAPIVAAHAQDMSVCGSLQNAFGPHDYRTATAQQRSTVENFHFTRDVETLRRGASSTRIGADLDYTLRAFPNHPRALLAMTRLAEKERTPRPRGASYTVECYFDRAIRFTSDDPSVRLLYGTLLLKSGKREAAIEQLKTAEHHAGANGNVYYNLGLAYFDLKDYEKSRNYAKRAYELGFTLPGLKNKLQSVGQWRD
jgi:tetratricopeptide (TPR) repeat protein